jgi:hypothetical protein
MVAAAVIGGAVIGAAGSAMAGSSAASATKSATNASIQAQKDAQAQQAALNAPYAAIGTGGLDASGKPKGGGAIDLYKNLLGLGPKGFAGIESTLANTPGYQFAKQQGLSSTTNAASSMGLGLSGNTLQALDKFSTGLADSTYQEAVGNAQNAVTIGQNAAAGTGAGIMQTGQGISNALISQGSTLAGIDANTAAGITRAIGGGINNYETLNTLQGLNSPGNNGLSIPGNSIDSNPAVYG